MLYSVQYLRGIAALIILLMHMSATLNGVYAQSNLGDILFGQFFSGVDLFFIISGFVICLSTEKNESNRCIKYITRRTMRIYPLLLFCVIIFSIIAILNNITDHGVPNLHNIIKSLIPLHIDYRSLPPFFGYNLLPPAWTLTYEIAFYALFFIALTISNKHKILIAIFLIISLFLTTQIYLTGKVSLSAYNKINYPETLIRPILAIISSPMLFEFLYGIIAYLCYKYVQLPETQFVKVFLIFLILSSFIVISSGSLLPSGNELPPYRVLHGPANWGMYVFIILTCSVMYEKTFGLCKNKALNKLGDISYSVYLTQWIWFKIFPTLHLFQKMSGFSKFSLQALIIVTSSYMTFNLIEKPFIKLSRRLTKAK